MSLWAYCDKVMTMMTTAVEIQPKNNDEACKYLRVYNADIDWKPHVNEVFTRLRSQFPDDEERRLELKKRLACTILLPFHEPNTIQDPPQNLLFYVHKWQQYKSRDWLAEFQKVYKRDREIDAIRANCLSIGVVHPLQYNPNTREAYNWLCNQATESGAITPENKLTVEKNMQNLVYAYGGVVITNIVFNKPEYKSKIANFPNWRSGYFFERLINEIYPESDLVKIKTHEINKIKNVDPKLIKMIKTKD